MAQTHRNLWGTGGCQIPPGDGHRTVGRGHKLHKFHNNTVTPPTSD